MLDQKEGGPEKKLYFHPQATAIAYKHKRELSRLFRDVIGLHFLDYAEIYLVSPNGETLFFSSSPSLTTNLIDSCLWEHDKALSLNNLHRSSWQCWEELYPVDKHNELKQTKEFNYGFRHGFITVRIISDFTIVYSFATKNRHLDNDKYYKDNSHDILKIGDYLYRKIRKLAQKYMPHNKLPIINKYIPLDEGRPEDIHNKLLEEHLTLIVDNKGGSK